MTRRAILAAASPSPLLPRPQPAPNPCLSTRPPPTCLKPSTSSRPCTSPSKPTPGDAAPLITVDDAQTFQQIDGFGASLTDSAAWLFAKKLTPAQTDAALKTLFSRRDGIALSFLRQPIGSSDLAVTFYSFDDLCPQSAKACTTPPGTTDPRLTHFSLAHDQEYILPLLKKALAINPELHVMLTPWSPPGWMKTSGSMLGQDPDTKQPSTLRPEVHAAFANTSSKPSRATRPPECPSTRSASRMSRSTPRPPTAACDACRRAGGFSRQLSRPRPRRRQSQDKGHGLRPQLGPALSILRRFCNDPKAAAWPPEPHGTTTPATQPSWPGFTRSFPRKTSG